MAVPAVPKLSDLVTEFGGPGNLRAYNRGGSYVPNRSSNTGISTNVADLQLSDFAGAVSEIPVDLVGDSLSDFELYPGTSQVGYQLSNSGVEQSYEGAGSPFSTINTWLIGGVNSDYECQLTYTGDTVTGPTGWNSLSTTRSWYLTRTTNGASSASCTIQIRDAVTLAVLAADSVSMSADMEP
jgi:hypothetical protein